jgi:hypothetical protein
MARRSHSGAFQIILADKRTLIAVYARSGPAGIESMLPISHIVIEKDFESPAVL